MSEKRCYTVQELQEIVKYGIAFAGKNVEIANG